MRCSKYARLCLLGLIPALAWAQEIPIKSVPVATGTQFLLFPSETAAMGGVTFALSDPLADPFDNPARGVAVRGAQFSSTPHYYKIGETSFGRPASSARSLPLAALINRGGWFGGAALVWQEMSTADVNAPCCWDFAVNALTVAPTERSSLSLSNLYTFAMGGTTVPGTNLSVGASVFTGNLKGLEGVRLLYREDADVEQDGGFATWRLGFLQQWRDGRTAELLFAHHRFKMDHTLNEFVWNEDLSRSEQQTRTEYDETRSFAMRLGYEQPLVRGWRMGARLVGDWKTHPKIPNYELMQIPRDPGNSSAYNVGVGFARTVGRSTYGLDYVFEPIWSHTWANALEDTPVRESDAMIPAGAMTVENYFTFRNQAIRMGLRQRGQRFEFSTGLGLRLYRYTLNQENFVQRLKRTLDQSWSEWTLSTGIGYRFGTFSLQYLTLWTWGTGLPGLAASRPGFAEDAFALASNFVVAPAGPLDLARARVWTHRVAIVIPLAD